MTVTVATKIKEEKVVRNRFFSASSILKRKKESASELIPAHNSFAPSNPIKKQNKVK